MQRVWKGEEDRQQQNHVWGNSRLSNERYSKATTKNHSDCPLGPCSTHETGGAGAWVGWEGGGRGSRLLRERASRCTVERPAHSAAMLLLLLQRLLLELTGVINR